VAIVVGSLLAVVYAWRVIEAAYFRPLPAEGGASAEAPLGLLLVTLMAALANLYFGIFTDLPVTLSSIAAEELRELMP
jgi:multicomponent Na+:H+ antiporter subunit D